MLFSVSIFSYAETVPDRTFQQLGIKAALNDEPTGLSFVTGFTFGLTLPFVTGSAAALVYNSTGKNKNGSINGIVTGIGTAVLWPTIGSRVNKKRRITVPDRHTEGLSSEGRLAFDSAYKETVRERRKVFYKVGFIAGVVAPVFILIFAMGGTFQIGN